MALIISIRRTINPELMAEVVLSNGKALVAKTTDTCFDIGLSHPTKSFIGDAFLSMFLMLVIHITRWAND